jgi:hypothetical protein
MMKSWKTTAAGWVGFVASLAPIVLATLNDQPVTNAMWGVAGTAFMVALGLTTARDNGVTSKQAGAEK